MTNPVGLGELISRVRSTVLATGAIDQSTGHEPKAAPGSGIRLAVFAGSIAPAPGLNSGLSTTSVVATILARLTLNMIYEPQDDIDSLIGNAADKMVAALAADFTLGGDVGVRAIDLRGMSGASLRCDFGYLPVDGKMFRAATITIPILINDVWSEAP